MRYFPLGIIGAIALIVLSAVFGCFYTVDQGQRGVLLTNGAFSGIADPGLHFKAPFFQSVVKVSTQQQTAYWGFEGERPVMEGYSRDQQAAKLLVSVTYHIPPDQVEKVYAQYGSLDVLEERTVARLAPQTIKTVFGQYDAVTVIQSRAKFNNEVSKAVTDAVRGPVVVDAVQIENIDFSDAYENAVEARMTAQVEVQKREQQLAQEKVNAEIAITQAKAQADSALAVAKAQADATKLAGDAEASAIRAKGDALRDNPTLIDLTKAEKWNGILPTTMVPGNAVPFIDVGK